MPVAGMPLDWELYHDLREEVKTKLREVEKGYIQEELEHSQNTRLKWEVIRSCIPCRETTQQVYTRDLKEVADEFNQFFTSVSAWASEPSRSLLNIHNLVPLLAIVPGNKISEVDKCLTFVGGVTTPTCSNTSKAEPAANSQISKSDPGWHVKLKIQDQDTLTLCIDRGAQVSVMPEHIYKSSYRTLSKSDRELVGAGDVPLKTLGCAVMNLKQDKTVIKEQVYIVSGASKLLLGIPTIRSLGLIHDIPGTYSVTAAHQTPDSHPLQLATKGDIVKQYPTLFQSLGKLEGEHTIHLKEGATPFGLTTPRRVPLPLMKQVQKEIKRIEQLDVIEPVDELTEWCSPIVVVPKADGRVWICVDLTRLNQAVLQEVYQMPTVEETLGSLTEGSVFSKLDANSGFHQIVLNPESAKLTTFITPFGRYMFKRLPFGISSAPEYFQTRMDKELSGIEGVKCRMDDILIIGRELKRIFSRHGIPDILFSENGLQFDSREFTTFSTDWQLQHITSSPRYPHSNGEVERAVQTKKTVLNKSSDEYLALLNYRDTPLHHGHSPAQLSMGRKLLTRVPCHPDELKPETPDYDHIRRKEKEY